MKINGRLKRVLKSNKSLYQFLSLMNLILRSKVSEPKGTEKQYPVVIQLPITKKCNSRCIMCDIWKMDMKNEMSPEELGEFLKDPVFKNVKSVGINGGEPSVLPNLTDYAHQVMKLPRLASLNIISNGLNTEKLLIALETIYQQCQLKNISFHVSLSLDGVGEIHDSQRGIPGAFSKTITTIDSIIGKTGEYCDSFDIGCTVTRVNVDHLVQLEVYSREKGYPMKYRLGIENKRIGSDQIKSRYSVLDDFHTRQSAMEFFFYLYHDREKIADKYSLSENKLLKKLRTSLKLGVPL